MRILIVEDLPTDAELAKREIEKEFGPCEFCCVETPEDYLQALNDFQPSIIVSDYAMPRFDGMSALKLALERMPNVPFILLTGSVNEETAVECMKAGAWDYVIKGHARRLGPALKSALEQGEVNKKRQQAEAALKQSENFQKRLLEAIPIPLFYKDAQGRYLGANRAFETFIGITRQQMLGKTVFDINPPELAQIYYAKDLALFENGGVQQYVTKAQNARDQLRDVIFNKAALTDSQGKVCGLIGTILDITDRTRSEKSLKESEKRYRALFNSIRDAILVADTERKIVDCNKMFSDLFGYTLDQIKGEKTSFVYDKPEEYESLRQELKKNIELPNFVHTIHYRKKSGEVFPGETTVFYLKDSSGKFMGFIGLIRDVSDRARYEAEKAKLETQLRQAQKMEAIGTLAGGIAHDFNNILSSIIGYTELAMYQAEKDATLCRHLEQVLQAGQRATSLVRQILNFSRQTEQEQNPLQMELIVNETLKLLKSSTPSTIAIMKSIGNNLPDIIADPTQVHQVIMNLCTNAVQAMEKEGGKLLVSLEQVFFNGQEAAANPGILPGGYLGLSVSDTGPGIDWAIRDSIFNPYFTTKPKGEGTGLGLAAVYSIMQNLGGSISVKSEPGKGATFKALFPVAGSGAALNGSDDAAGRRDQAPLPTGKGHILLVDDEPSIVDIGRQMLKGLGYTVETRTNAMEALALFKTAPERFDAVITDLTMPHMTGDRLAREVLALRPGLPVILCTGYSKIISSEETESIGIHALVRKPILKKDLAFIVADALKSKS